MVLFMPVWRHLWHSGAVVVFFLKVFQWHFQNSFRACRQIMTYAAHDHMGSTVTSDLMTMHLLSGVRGFVAMGMTTCAPFDLILGRNTAVHSAFVRTQHLVRTIVTCNMCNKSDIPSHMYSWKAWQFCLYYLSNLGFRIISQKSWSKPGCQLPRNHLCLLNFIKPYAI